MNGRVFWAFYYAALIQVIYAPPPPVSFEVNPDTATIGVENALTKNAASGDVMLKTPEPLGAGVTNIPTVASDVTEQVISDHVLPTTTPILNGNIASNVPSVVAAVDGANTVAAAASSSSSPSFISATTNTPLDNEITFGSGASADFPAPDPLLIYRLMMNMLRRQEKFMQNPFSGLTPSSFPQIQIPQIQIPPIQIPQIQVPSIRIPGLKDPALKLVDQQKFNEGGLQGEIKTYEGRPDSNIMTKMQTGQFSLNGDGVPGTGQRIISQSTSSVSGSNPLASVSTFFNGIPSRMNVGLPMFRFS